MDENKPLKNDMPQSTFNSTDNKVIDNNIDTDSAFFCNVCLEPVKNKEPVVTQCGHLYCWPCLYRWLNTNHSTCPVCKAGVTEENIIPIFIRGGSAEDPRSKRTAQDQIPNRPLGHRPEPQIISAAGLPNSAANIAQFGGITFSAGFGFFPSLFGLQFQSFTPLLPSNGIENPEEAQQLYLSRVLFLLGFAVILCLLFF
jgi:E3 ubiquitin-protein ligase RNF5